MGRIIPEIQKEFNDRFARNCEISVNMGDAWMRLTHVWFVVDYVDFIEVFANCCSVLCGIFRML